MTLIEIGFCICFEICINSKDNVESTCFSFLKNLSSYEIITFLLSISGTRLMAFSFIIKIGPHPPPVSSSRDLYPVTSCDSICAGESFRITMTVEPAVWSCRWPWLLTSPLEGHLPSFPLQWPLDKTPSV